MEQWKAKSPTREILDPFHNGISTPGDEQVVSAITTTVRAIIQTNLQNPNIIKTILTLAITLLILAAAQVTAKADECYRSVSYCRPHVVCTEIINQCRERRSGYDSCGSCYYYFVTVVTYRDAYSNGASQCYTRSFRA